MPNLGIPPCLILLDTGNTSSITMWYDSRDMNDGPLSFAIKYVSNLNTPLGKPVTYIDNNKAAHLSTMVQNVHENIYNSNTIR